MKTFLKEWIDEMGVGIEELASSSKLSAKMIQKYVDGETTPSLSAMKAISDTINVSIDYLLGFSPEDVKNSIADKVEEMSEPEPAVEEVKIEPELQFTTTDICEAVAMDYFLTEQEMPHYIYATVTESGDEIFNIYAETVDCIWSKITLKNIAKEIKSFRFRNKRNKEDSSEKRYDGMMVYFKSQDLTVDHTGYLD